MGISGTELGGPFAHWGPFATGTMKRRDAAATEAEAWRGFGAIRKGMAAMRCASPAEPHQGISWPKKRLLPLNSSGQGDILVRGGEMPCGGCDSLRRQN